MSTTQCMRKAFEEELDEFRRRMLVRLELIENSTAANKLLAEEDLQPSCIELEPSLPQRQPELSSAERRQRQKAEQRAQAEADVEAERWTSEIDANKHDGHSASDSSSMDDAKNEHLAAVRALVACVFPGRSAGTPQLSQPSSERSQNAANDPFLYRLATHPVFEGFFTGLILFHTLMMALSAQYHGMDTGYALRYPRSTVMAADAWPGTESILDVLDKVFAVLYTCELVAKLLGLRRRFFYSGWNLLDFVLVALWYIDEMGHLGFVNPMMLRLARLGKLMRIVRHMGWLKSFDSLHMLISAISASLSALLWSTMLLGALLALASLLTNGLLSSYLEDVDTPIDERRAVYKFFGTFTKSFVSFFEMAFASHAPIVRTVAENVSEWYALYFIAIKTVFSLSVMRVISGVFLHETFKVCSNDDELMTIQRKRMMKSHTDKMRALFNKANSDGGDTLSHSEFIHIMEDDWVRTWMASMEVDMTNIQRLWQLLDSSGDGQLSAHELVSGVARLKGAARSIDMISNLQFSAGIVYAVDDLHNMVAKLTMVVKWLQERNSANPRSPAQNPGCPAKLLDL